MLCLLIWHQNFGRKYGTQYSKGWAGTRGNNPGMDILTAGEEIVPKFDVVVKVEVRGEEGTPVKHTYQQKNMYICAPFSWG